MATLFVGILGRGRPLRELGRYPLQRVQLRIASEARTWRGTNSRRSGISHCAILDKSGRSGHVGEREVQRGGLGAEEKGFDLSRNPGIQRNAGLRWQQTRCVSTQGTNDQKPSNNKTSAPLQKATLTPLTLHEDIYTIPNILTATRLLCAPAIGYLLLHSSYPWALSLFIYAGITDLVDGWIARRYNSGTVVGTVLDPMADKMLMTIVVGVLGWQHLLPLPLAVLILGRDVLLSITAFYYRYISLPPPRTLARYWDFSLPSAEVKPTTISKVNTFLQVGLIGATMTGLAFPALMTETMQSAMVVSWWVVGGTTIWSGASYLGKGGVKILGMKAG